MAYEPPRVSVLGTVREMTLDVSINKTGKGSDQFSSLLAAQNQPSTGSIVSIH